MADSSVKIANLALRKIGAQRISSFNESNESARTVNEFYNDILDEVLTEHPWTFAQSRAVLSMLAITPEFDEDSLSYVFAKPTDFLKLNFTNSRLAIIKIESDGIHCNLDTLKIIYTARVTEPTKYTPQFVKALYTRLAAEIGFTLTNSTAKTTALFEEYEKIALPRAIASDSQQDTPQAPVQDEWERARRTGSGGIFGVPGQEVWHPYSI